MKFPIKRVIVGVALFGALIVLYLKANPIVSAEHRRFENGLNHVQQLDMTLDQDVLKARFHLISNYDAFSEESDGLKQAVDNLGAVPSFIPKHDQGTIRSQTDGLAQLVANKEELLESFKSQNAALNNSLTYLPTAVTSLIQRLSTYGNNSGLEDILNELMRQVLVYDLDSTGEHASDIHRSLGNLNEWRAQRPALPQATTLASFDSAIAHVNAIVSRKEKVEALTRQIISIPIVQKVNMLADSYNDRFDEALKTAALYETAWRILCGLLAIGIGYTIYALKTANVCLDGRVAERTKDLAYERGLLRSLLFSSPDAIYFKDSQSRFLKTSAAYATTLGLKTVDEIVGKSDFEFLTEEDARGAYEEEQEIVRTGLPLIGNIKKASSSNGAESWSLTSKMPLLDEHGNIIGTFGISKDITEIKENEARIERTHNELLNATQKAKIAEDALRGKTAFLEAQANSFIDGILVVDRQNKKVFQNQRFADLWKIPSQIAEDTDDRPQLEWVINAAKAPDQFKERVAYLNAHPNESGREEIDLKNGTVLDRHSSPVFGKDGEYYGRIWAFRDIIERKKAEKEMERLNKQLLETSRQAGMAEVATSVLHNVGNVLNSVNISATLVIDGMRQSQIMNLGKVAAMFDENMANLGHYIMNDNKGKQLPGYIRLVSEALVREREFAVKELESLCDHIEHIKDIVSKQQSYAKISGVLEVVEVMDLIENSLCINAASLKEHNVALVREYEKVPSIRVDKHLVLQILVNLVSNAKHACHGSGKTAKQLIVRLVNGEQRVKISVIDNGVGIAPENLTRIFNHGFTTRKDGHGFGLHSGALAAKELGGALFVHSDGLGVGATFTLELPIVPR